MAETMTFTDQQWALIVQLLEREARELPSEIRHTSSYSVREELRRRLAMLREMITRFHEPAGA